MGQTIILRGPQQQALACGLVRSAPADTVLTLSAPKRSLDQNAMLWACLSDVARARPEGRVWTPEVWKAAFMHYLGHEIQWQPGLDGKTPFPVGFRSSRLTKPQFADLLTCVLEYGDRHGVTWTAPTHQQPEPA